MAKKYLKNSDGYVMAMTTTNLQLEKPLSNEHYNIEVQNRNMDKIDEAIQEVKSGIDSLELIASNVKMADGSTVEDTVSTNKSNISSLETKVTNLYGNTENLKGEHILKSYPGKYFSSATTETDLNTIKYNLICYTAAADNLLNLPPGETGGSGMLEITKTFTNNSNQHTIQRFTNTVSNKTYIRCYNKDKNTWTEWREL